MRLGREQMDVANVEDASRLATVLGANHLRARALFGRRLVSVLANPLPSRVGIVPSAPLSSSKPLMSATAHPRRHRRVAVRLLRLRDSYGRGRSLSNGSATRWQHRSKEPLSDDRAGQDWPRVLCARVLARSAITRPRLQRDAAMKWYYASSCINDANDPWLTGFVPDKLDLSFEAVPACHHHSVGATQSIRTWRDHLNHGSQVGEGLRRHRKRVGF